MGASRWVFLEGCFVAAATEKALLVEYDDEQYWIPRSQIEDGEKYEKGDEDVTLAITEFIAREKGIDTD